LEALEWTISSEVKLGIVTTIEQADKLPDFFEPLMLEGETLLLKELVEDELLLALPTFPKHAHECFNTSHFQRSADINKAELFREDKPSSRENPFSILANLKNTGDS
jgi:uncharacterized protein